MTLDPSLDPTDRELGRHLSEQARQDSEDELFDWYVEDATGAILESEDSFRKFFDEAVSDVPGLWEEIARFCYATARKGAQARKGAGLTNCAGADEQALRSVLQWIMKTKAREAARKELEGHRTPDVYSTDFYPYAN